MENIEDILIATDHLKESYSVMNEVTAGEVWSGVKNFFRSNINDEKNKALYKSNLKVLKTFEGLINNAANKNQKVATKGKSADEVKEILNIFSKSKDWYALISNEPADPNVNGAGGTGDTSGNGTNENGTNENGAGGTGGTSGNGTNENGAGGLHDSLSMSVYDDYVRFLEDLSDYASQNIDKSNKKAAKQQKNLLKQCREILLIQGGGNKMLDIAGKSCTLVALYTILTQYEDIYNSSYTDKGFTQFFSDWLAGKLMSPEEAAAQQKQQQEAQMKQVGEKANDCILLCMKAGIKDYNTFIAQVQELAKAVPAPAQGQGEAQ